MREIDWAKLREPIPLDGLQFFPGATNQDKTQGLVLAYIDATFAADRLDEACGPENWDLASEEVREGDKVICVRRTLRLQVAPDKWVGRADYGYPNTDDDAEPLKSMASDGLKRCLWLWGGGRELRHAPQLWHPLVGEGKYKRFAAGVREAYAKAAEGGATEPPAPAPAESRGNCLVHNKPFVHRVGTSAKGNAYDFWTCPYFDMVDGKRVYCKQKPPTATSEDESILDNEPPPAEAGPFSDETHNAHPQPEDTPDLEAQAKQDALLRLHKGGKTDNAVLIAARKYCLAQKIENPPDSYEEVKALPLDVLNAMLEASG